MKSNFHEVRERQSQMLPAEACSELGYVGKTRQQPDWIARWLQVTHRQWFAQNQRNF